MKRGNLIIAMALTLSALSSCIHPQIKFRKAGLLDPTMDPAKTDAHHSAFSSEATQWNENAQIGSGSSAGASCPTCG